MTYEKIISVVEMYRRLFEEKGIPKKRIDTALSFQQVPVDETLAHAHYLLDGIVEYARDPERQGKTGRHLASVQMILSFAGWFTLDDIKSHNRPDQQQSA